MRVIRMVGGLSLVLGLVAGPRVEAAVIETPANGGRASGIGVVAGWKCQAGQITVAFDGGEYLPAAWGVPRGDTAGSCGDRNNGWVMQFNFALLGDGSHVVRVYDNGSKFAEARFTVATLGVPFLRGAAGAYTLPNFPAWGASARIEWDQGAQSFMVTSVTWPQPTPRPTVQPTPRPTPPPTPRPTPPPTPRPTPPPTNCPTNGPLTDVRRDCSSIMYFYRRGSELAGYITNGDVAVLCESSDPAYIYCYRGAVGSASQFDLAQISLNESPFVTLRSDSEARFRNSWRTLDLYIRFTSGGVYDELNLAFDSAEFVSGSAEPLNAGAAAPLTRVPDEMRVALSAALSAPVEMDPSDVAGRTARSELNDSIERAKLEDW